MFEGASIAEVPSGTVVFLFSDIEGSTQRWELFGDAMAPALRRHDEIVATEIRACGGYVFKTVGDAFCAAFATAGAAVAAAVAVQRALARENWAAIDGLAVRIAVHAGPAEQRDGDYFGGTVNRVARLLAIAHGGQTVLSEGVAALVRDALPAGVLLHDLGLHGLKDLKTPERVAQLDIAGLRTEFAPLRSIGAALHNLPLAVTPLLGREREALELETLLVARRLVTIAGPGGVGKTRIALHVAAESASACPDGVWYVELAPLADAALVHSTIARELGLRETPGHTALQSLVSALATKRLLLILDNCEHVIGEAARAVDSLLKAAPHVRVLATSREPLAIAGEHVYRLASLSVPPPAVRLRAADAPHYGAVALFCERAVAVDPTFALTDATAPIVADICRRLDGIALAIELAAPRVRVLPLATLDAKLDERFRLLSGGRRADRPRQQTLHALIDWSYELLGPSERAVFMRLSAFTGPWTLDGANAVCCDEEIDEFDLMEILTALVDKSLVAVEGDDERNRYRLLESMRAFAELRLHEANQTERIRSRHAAWVLAEAQRLDLAWASTPSALWERAIRELVPDARAAVAWALDAERDVALGLRLVAALRVFYARFAPIEGRREIRAALARTTAFGAEPDILAALWLADANVSMQFLDWTEQAASAERAATLFGQLGNGVGEALALRMRGQALRVLGRPEEAVPFLERALAAFRALGQDRFVALTLDELAQLHRMTGENERARGEFDEALRLARRTSYDHGLLSFESNFAELEYRLGNIERAIELARSAMSRSYTIASAIALAVVTGNLAMYLADRGTWLDAREAAETALHAAGDFHAHSVAYVAIQTLATVWAAEGDYPRAAELLGFADDRLAKIGVEREYTEHVACERLRASLESALGFERVRMLEADGAALDFPRAVARATAHQP